METQKVAGIFLTQREASEAIEELKRYGYDADDISVISKDHQDAAAIGEQTGTKAPEGAAGGATAGGILGGVGGLLAGLGALAIPGIGPLLAAGPIATALAGIAVGATGGGLVGGLIGLGIPEEDAKAYDQHIGGGRMLVLVDTTSDRKEEAEDIFRRHYALNHTRLGADGDNDNLTVAAPHASDRAAADLRETTEVRGTADVRETSDAREMSDVRDAAPLGVIDGIGQQERDSAYPAGTGRDTEAALQREPETHAEPEAGRDAIQLRAEQLDIDKKQVRTGEVEVRKEIVHEEKVIRVPVSHEEVVIERRAVDGEATDEQIGRDETIRIPVSEERIEVNKRSVVTGEVDVYKQEVEETRHIEETLRHEEARVERTGHAAVDEDSTGEASERRPFAGASPSPPATDASSLPPRSERPRR